MIIWGYWHKNLNKEIGYFYLSCLSKKHEKKGVLKRMSEEFKGIVERRIWANNILRVLKDEKGGDIYFVFL